MTTTDTATVLAVNLGIVAGLGVVLWGLSLRLRDASIIDLAWGPFFAMLAWATWVAAGAPVTLQLILPIAVSAWAARLFLHLYVRNVGHGEDRRYAAMRAARGDGFRWWSLPAIFLFQPLLAVLIGLPIQIGVLSPRPPHLTPFDIIGGAIFLGGLLFEAIADYQLQSFRRRPRSSDDVMNEGLWRYSRHPNYFGEALLWWGLWLIAAAAPDARWTALGPAVLTFLLLRVSGVSLLERTITSRRPAYAAYQRRTSPFFPWPPRKDCA